MSKRPKPADDIAEHIRRLWAVVDAIDADCEGRPYPNRGRVKCPNCEGMVTYLNLTKIHGAGRCSGSCGVEFAPLRLIGADA